MKYNLMSCGNSLLCILWSQRSTEQKPQVISLSWDFCWFVVSCNKMYHFVLWNVLFHPYSEDIQSTIIQHYWQYGNALIGSLSSFQPCLILVSLEQLQSKLNSQINYCQSPGPPLVRCPGHNHGQCYRFRLSSNSWLTRLKVLKVAKEVS